MGATQSIPNVNQQTIPMFSPDGKVRDIPIAQISQARTLGAKPAVQVKSPAGDVHWIPADRLKDATAAGGQIVPIENQETQHPGFWDAVIDDVKGAAKGAVTAGAAAFGSPTAREEFTEGLVNQIQNAPGQYQQEKQAGYSLPYRVIAPVAQAVAGVNVPGMEEAARQGDVGGVAGHAAVPAAAAVAPLAVEGAARGANALRETAAESPTFQAAAAGAKAAAKKLPAAAVKRIPYVGSVAGDVTDAARAAYNEAKAGANTSAVADEDFTEPGTSPQTESASESEEPIPSEVKPPIGSELSTLPPTGALPKAQTGEALATVKPRTVEIDPTTGIPEFSDVIQAKQNVPPDTSPKAIQQKLESALGGQKLVPGVPIKNQPAAMQAAAGNLPDGFTPVDSSALKGYKYNPETREFESITTGGQHYIHGDVSPDEAQAFADAYSKGKAWQQIRQNPLVAKVVNGKRVSTIPTRAITVDPETKQPEFSDVVEAKAQPETTSPTGQDDLTSLLQQSVEKVQQAKSTAPPQYIYRVRDIGEKGVPLNNSVGHATESLAEAQQYLKHRQTTQGGTPQEIVRINLGKVPKSQYSMRAGPNGPRWFTFKNAIPENVIKPVDQPSGVEVEK